MELNSRHRENLLDSSKNSDINRVGINIQQNTKTMKTVKTAKKMSEASTQEIETQPVEPETPAPDPVKEKKGKKPTKPDSEKSKEELKKEMEKNAAIIQAGRQAGAIEVIPPELIVPSERPINEITSEWISYGKGHTYLVVKEGMPIDQWTAALAGLLHMQEHMGFMIGDMIRYGEGHYAEKFAAAIKAVNRDVKTLTNWAIVSKKVPPEHRREELTFSHHAEVSKFSDTPAVQKRLLARAVEGKMSVSKLREEIDKLETKKAGAQKAADAPVASPQDGTQAPAGASSGGVTEGEYGTASEGSELGLVGETSVPAPQTATTTTGISSEDRIKNDEQIERADSLQTYIRGELWKKLATADKKQWLSVLKPIVDAYELLLDEVG